MAILDTGSPFLIISNPNSNYCQSTGQCSIFASYDPIQSTSAVWVSDDMNVVYELTSDAGSWFYDALSIGNGISVPTFPIGTANGSSTHDIQNTFGFGGAGGAGPNPDANTLQLLAKAGAIPSASIAMYLGALDSTDGQALFGGLDTSKWQGNLSALPIVQNENNEIQITLSSVALSDQDVTSDNLPVPVMVDTGNFDIKLPQDVVDAIWSRVGGIQAVNFSLGANSLPYGVCACSLAQSSDTVTFGFDGVSIVVPMSDLVLPPSQLVLQEAGLTDFPQDTCLFLINGWGPTAPQFSPFIIGDAFLRNAYFVLDWDSNEVALGQANNDGGDSNIITIAAGTSGLQDAIASASSGQTSTGNPTSTAGAPSSTASASTVTGAPSPSATGGSSSNAASHLSQSGLILFGVTLFATWSSWM
ncbi:hypothetical protein H2200_008734 [Cladophialophora chaetospira]|uniref:Peptidase A1 domain-containing protein n=1 Tax=Cladophialophora chaetospira TaxID=386627 RepID=A0AA38X513_9EURO|nr:hypothetical protein H2200_008734 [Cladophialophora chaetospira]